MRIDTGVGSGSTVPPHYDSMVAKVIVHAPTRAGAARTLAAALERARLHGPDTNRDQLVRVLRHPDFLAGDLHTGFLDEHPCSEPIETDVALAAAAVALVGAGVQPGRRTGVDRRPVGVAEQPGGRPVALDAPRRGRSAPSPTGWAVANTSLSTANR